MKKLIEKYNTLAKNGNGNIRNTIGIVCCVVVVFVVMFVACGMDAGIF